MQIKKRFQPLGQRIIKSSAGVFLCFLVYLIRGKSGIPFYSMLAVLWCVQPYAGKTLVNALQRSLGTLIGAFFGLISILVEIYLFDIYDTFWGYFFTAAMIIPVIYSTVVINKKNASYFSCVVFLSITVMHITDSNPFIFVLNRVIDTFIGIAIGIIVNTARLPRRKVKDTLFVADFDDMVTPVNQQLSAYSKVEINRMLDDGVKFTIATMRTPASLMKVTENVNLNLPVIVMDGAALYDMAEKTYLKAYIISNSTTQKLTDMIKEEGLNCFLNALCDDTLIIYYDKLENEAEKKIYSTLKKSPYRNYINRAPSDEDRIIYIMLIDKTEKIQKFYSKLISTELGQKLKILSYPSDDFKGYSYIKIYNKNAIRQNMIQYLANGVDTNSVITL
ncbi:MAG: HAD hydrolase family protein, partial [Oscillospiraceae bacterium]